LERGCCVAAWKLEIKSNVEKKTREFVKRPTSFSEPRGGFNEEEEEVSGEGSGETDVTEEDEVHIEEVECDGFGMKSLGISDSEPEVLTRVFVPRVLLELVNGLSPSSLQRLEGMFRTQLLY
jgi:hypothetical protein